MERTRFLTLVHDSITTLCRNALLADGVRSVQGLIGITLKTDEVLLVNIQEEMISDMDLRSSQTIKPPPSPEDITLVIAPETDPMPCYPEESPPTCRVKIESPKDEMIFLSDESDIEEKSSPSSVHFADSSLMPSSDFGKLLMDLKADDRSDPSPPGGGRHGCPAENCVYTSKRRYNVLRHIRSVHHNIRFPCAQCSRSFNSKYSLKQHLDTVHTPRTCTVCAVDLPNSEALVLHLKSHG